MKKTIFILLLTLPIAFLTAFKGGEADKKTVAPLVVQDDAELADCLTKYKSKWGEACNQCGNSPDTYVVYLKNTCSKKLDIMIGVQEESKWWRIVTFLGVNANDTLRAYACKGTGKYLKWAREAGDKSYAFPTQTEVNEQYK